MARLKTQAKEQAAAMKLADAPKKRKRRWPKVMLLGIVAAGVAYVVRNRAATPEPTPFRSHGTARTSRHPEDSASAAANGQRPQKSPTKQG